MKVTAGKYQRFYDPSIGEKENWYINDHCIVKGDDGWHLFGITHTEPAAPLDEKCCAHAIGASLSDTAWKKLPFPIVTDPKKGEAHFWAPHVIFHDGLYYMYWCAGSLEGHDKYQIRMATSRDLYTWERVNEVNPIIIDGFDARDPMVLRVEDKWVLYYTANSTPQGGHHLVACVTSNDLIHWGNKRIVFTDPNQVPAPVRVNRHLSFGNKESTISLSVLEIVSIIGPVFLKVTILSPFPLKTKLAKYLPMQQKSSLTMTELITRPGPVGARVAYISLLFILRSERCHRNTAPCMFACSLANATFICTYGATSDFATKIYPAVGSCNSALQIATLLLDTYSENFCKVSPRQNL